jgi:hypothetical protein
MPRRTTNVRVRNLMGARMKMLIQHQYTGDATETSDWVTFGEGETKLVMQVHYNTGFLTTGIDNWLVDAIELTSVNANINVSDMAVVNVGGEMRIKRYKIVTPPFCNWKGHILREADEAGGLLITMTPSLCEFNSETGRSEAGVKLEFVPTIGY